MPDVTAAPFDREEMAAWYARQHRAIDPGIAAVYHLPAGAPPREIRLVEVNADVAELTPLEAIDFGVDVGTDSAHTLYVLDVTPAQWQAVQDRELFLPRGWALEGHCEVKPRGGP